MVPEWMAISYNVLWLENPQKGLKSFSLILEQFQNMTER